MINPLTALFDVCNGEILRLPDYHHVANRIVEEGIQVASCCNIQLDFDECMRRVHWVAEQTAGNVSSMLSDVRKQCKTEIDFINGYIVKMGKQFELKTPVNELMTSLIHMKEGSSPL